MAHRRAILVAAVAAAAAVAANPGGAVKPNPMKVAPKRAVGVHGWIGGGDTVRPAGWIGG